MGSEVNIQLADVYPCCPMTVRPLGSDRFWVRFDEPRHGVAPGQAAVCYDGDRVLGGGWIE